MQEKGLISGQNTHENSPQKSNVKNSKKYERFGETIRYLTYQELRKLFDSIENYREKLMLQVIYELGCRVGEFVRIKLKHLDFNRSSVFIPAENTKTNQRRTSCLPRGLMNEIKSILKKEGRMGKRDSAIKKPESYLFHPPGKPNEHYSENRIRQIFLHYIKKVELDREYGEDSKGRKLHQFTVHSMRHAHVHNYIHIHKLPLPIVQKQVGHKTLQATSAYLKPSDELVAKEYEKAQLKPNDELAQSEI